MVLLVNHPLTLVKFDRIHTEPFSFYLPKLSVGGGVDALDAVIPISHYVMPAVFLWSTLAPLISSRCACERDRGVGVLW